MRRENVIAAIVAVALFMEQVDATIIATALPAIAADLGTTPLTLNVAVTAYLLALAIFIPVSGWVADRFGARNVFRLAIVVFLCGSVCCALSNSLYTFVASRILARLRHDAAAIGLPDDFQRGRRAAGQAIRALPAACLRVPQPAADQRPAGLADVCRARPVHERDVNRIDRRFHDVQRVPALHAIHDFSAITFADVTPQKMSHATSLLAVSAQLSTSFGVAIGAMAVEFTMHQNGRTAPIAADFPPAFIAIALITFASFFLCLRLPADAGSEIANCVPAPAKAVEPPDEQRKAS